MQNSILNPKVLVRCMTYNHEKYIEDALNGFIIQKTDFPFTVAVVDDASTDNNVTVIKKFIYKNCTRTKNYIEEDKEYGKVIQSQATNNPNCHFYVVLLNNNHYSDPNKRALRHFYYRFIEDQAKYIAMCEGDDYWTDSLKLQKQVDFMESHPDYSVCCHGYSILFVDEGTIVERKACLPEESKDGYTFSNAENMRQWYTKTLTVLMRVDAYKALPDLSHFYCACDAHICYYLLKMGKGYYMPFNGGVYRAHNSGVYCSLSPFQKGIREIRIHNELCFYNPGDEDLVKILQQLIIDEEEEVIRLIRDEKWRLQYFKACIEISNILRQQKRYNHLWRWWKRLIVVILKRYKRWAVYKYLRNMYYNS